MDDRRELIVKLRVCKKCLRNHGESEACSVGPCHVCKSSHSILLCEDNEETASILTKQPLTKTVNKKVDLPENVDEALHVTEEESNYPRFKLLVKEDMSEEEIVENVMTQIRELEMVLNKKFKLPVEENPIEMNVKEPIETLLYQYLGRFNAILSYMPIDLYFS